MDGKTHPRFQQQQAGIMGRLDFFGVALRIRLCRFQELPLFVWRKDISSPRRVYVTPHPSSGKQALWNNSTRQALIPAFPCLSSEYISSCT